MNQPRFLVLPLAGALLLAAGGAVLATSGPGGWEGSGAAAPAAASPSPSVGARGVPGPASGVLADVLDRLVTEGTIDEAQRAAILDAVAAEHAARHEGMQALREQLRTLWADGRLTQEELDSLPADSPLRELRDLMDDGEITLEELRGFGGRMGRGHGFGHMGGRGPGPMGGGWMFPHASPDASGPSS